MIVKSSGSIFIIVLNNLSHIEVENDFDTIYNNSVFTVYHKLVDIYKQYLLHKYC